MRILRNYATYPGILNGLTVWTKRFTNSDAGAPHDFIIDNIPGTVVFAKGFIATTVVEPTSGAGTLPGTTKLTFAVTASGVLQALVLVSEGYNDNATTATGATDTDHEVR